MTRQRLTGRAYKDVTFQQLRSFCETARLGSLKAAAASLGVAQPTVWKQVHALERQLGTDLLESRGRGTALTEAGRMLAELAGPSVAGIASLKRQFREKWTSKESSLVVGVVPRILAHLPECLIAFGRSQPRVRLTVKEMTTIDQVASSVESGEADLGLTPDPWPKPRGPLLIYHPCYKANVLLVTPKNHALARRRHVRPSDLRDYPVVNSPDNIRDQTIDATLKRLGVYESHPCRVEAYYTGSVLQFVRMGFGVGLIAGLPRRETYPGLHVRDMSRYFEPIPVYSVSRKRLAAGEPAEVFAQLAKRMLR